MNSDIPSPYLKLGDNVQKVVSGNNQYYFNPDNHYLPNGFIYVNSLDDINEYVSLDDSDVRLLLGNDINNLLSAFTYNNYLESITLESGVLTTINGSFNNCPNLKSVNLSDSVISIDGYSFMNCSSLESIYLSENLLLITSGAFSGCESLYSIYIPKYVNNINLFSFRGCDSLESIVVDPDNEYFDSRNDCNAIIATSDNELIKGCKNTTIPNSVISLSDRAFSYCDTLINLVIPNGVTSIGNYCFEHNEGLESLVVPSSVISIGVGAFSQCGRLSIHAASDRIKDLCSDKGVTNDKIIVNYRDLSISNGNGGLLTNSIVISSGVYGPNSYNLTVGGNITSLDYGCFTNCELLHSLILDRIVNSIGSYCFNNCKYMESLTLPDSIISVGNNAFNYCDRLTIYVPNEDVKLLCLNKGISEDRIIIT